MSSGQGRLAGGDSVSLIAISIFLRKSSSSSLATAGTTVPTETDERTNGN
jgi:hypothetical protein